MKKNLKAFWQKWLKAGLVMGNFMSSVIMTVFYFTVFAIFAIPFSLFSKVLKAKSANSNWVPKGKNLLQLTDFKHEH